ncbi:four helix bundle protein [Hyphomicrobium sp. xq]|uniref:Four helix bundle protein n=1 Tax=Hyphomicrobium album TaxID=2665159 RepID=A0A6I3KQW5_9HYPH|nr:four helix bundle protein [Hyphomicrobium album]
MQTIVSHRDLRVWQEAMGLAEATYRTVADAPSRWRFALADQAIRAAASVPANIAEGYGRNSPGSYVQFLKVARGSLNELDTHILLAQRVGAFDSEQAARLLEQSERVGKMLNALIKSVRSTVK